MTPAPTFAFGDYLFVPGRQMLLKNGAIVRVGCRALDLLTAFVQRPGELLTKRELLEEAWPSTTVVEGNLKVHIAALRRALEDDVDASRYIATVNGRGYRFVAPVEIGEALTAGVPPPQPLTVAAELAAASPTYGSFQEALALLARTMPSTVIDVPVGQTGDPTAGPPRRILFIELTPRDEAWIDDMFAHRRRAIAATP
ncbi:transcriptional regulator [Caulobacter segnis]|uniref:winged helix-turn-helix domain-containing protein n=1 Tax=Caulobacter segnis TaxID=88688 RepID=UPI0028587125|nr:transcriptional regulator [Caulobacter segnis]MDR6624421.1 DNA-binding winged helix-turn-helix (wHTH) protein [Caulobacter segnis]